MKNTEGEIWSFHSDTTYPTYPGNQHEFCAQIMVFCEEDLDWRIQRSSQEFSGLSVWGLVLQSKNIIKESYITCSQKNQGYSQCFCGELTVCDCWTSTQLFSHSSSSRRQGENKTKKARAQIMTGISLCCHHHGVLQSACTLCSTPGWGLHRLHFLQKKCGFHRLLCGYLFPRGLQGNLCSIAWSTSSHLSDLSGLYLTLFSLLLTLSYNILTFLKSVFFKVPLL